MQRQQNGSLVTTEWLAAHLDDPDLVLLDASFKLPGVAPTAEEDFSERHIPCAQFFDVDAIADHKNPLPHMLPPPEVFAEHSSAFGISNGHTVIIYDTPGLMSAGRAWWMFRTFGHVNVAILDGGLKKWLAEGRPVTHEVRSRTRANFVARFNPAKIRDKAQLLANLSTGAEQVIDARSAARFHAEEKEARPGLRSGHIPGSLNLPFNLMTDPATGEMKSPQALRAAFLQAGLDFSRPAVASCGSGVTACALVFALHLLGKEDVAVYDGAWAEWGLPGSTPVEPA